MKIKVCVVGLGYIGLPTALLLAKARHQVYGVDVDQKKINQLQAGCLPFDENGLDDLFKKVQQTGNFLSGIELQKSDIFLIAVPTPQINGEADLSYVFKALDKIKEVFEDGNTIIIESTIGPLDSEKRIIPFIQEFGKKFRFTLCPERAIPGNTLYEMTHNARIIGGLTESDAEFIKKLYSTFVEGDIYITNPTVAAVCKVMENTYRDTNIALANEFAKIADEIDFDVWRAIELANKHPRVNILQPGPGVGGHCIPIDPWFLTAVSKQTDLILVTRKVNDGMPGYVSKQVEKLIQKHNIKNPIIGILGYAYKKNVNDTRETPAEHIMEFLSKNYKLLLYDPYVKEVKLEIIKLDKLLEVVDVVVLVTDHDEYKDINFEKYLNIKFIYDTRNLFTSANIGNSSVKLYTLGKGLK